MNSSYSESIPDRLKVRAVPERLLLPDKDKTRIEEDSMMDKSSNMIQIVPEEKFYYEEFKSINQSKIIEEKKIE